MKRVLALGALLLTVLLVSCRGEEGFDPAELQPGTVEEPGQQVSMQLAEDAFDATPTELDLVITNHTAGAYSYGLDYHLEVELAGSWYVVPPREELVFAALGVVLPGDGVNTQGLALAEYYGQLPQGRYRLVKTFFGQQGSCPAVAEFSILADSAADS